MTQGEAKRFFAERIIRQADSEGMSLSEAERNMLYWSESDPEFHPTADLVERLAAETSDEDYETKVADLAARALDTDASVNERAIEEWRAALRSLKQGDHYLVVMLDRGVGKRLTPWWKLRL